MKRLFLLSLIAAVATAVAAERPRVVVLTDIENEPDDAMSMVRFLTYANQFEIAGLVATTSVHQKNKVAPQRIRQIVAAYAKVRDNLELHEPGFPSGESLSACISEGLPVYGMSGVGEGKDSPGSELVIQAVDRDDARPVWVTVWGGPSVLAQALWKVRATRTPEAVARFVAKLRVYTISDQDDSGPWIRQNFPGVFYVVSPGLHAGGAYHHATWSGTRDWGALILMQMEVAQGRSPLACNRRSSRFCVVNPKLPVALQMRRWPFTAAGNGMSASDRGRRWG
jgi:hypothetical protein